MKPIQQTTVNLLLCLQEENRTQADKVRLLQDALDGTPALALVADIRAALGDNGKRMQDELVAYCKELSSTNAELQALFAKQWERSREADKLWQKATGKHDTIPDLGELLKWLMEQISEVEQLKAQLAQVVTDRDEWEREYLARVNPAKGGEA